MTTRHLVIAGTGRSGTSFLTRFLATCGLDTGESEWFERARAGQEHSLDSRGDLPYVVKDPWLWVYCRDVDLTLREIDALLVPIRDLSEAAASRVLQERAAIVDTPWRHREGLEVFARTAGGVVYSLSVADQARVLAVGFHRLLEWAVQKEIPLFLLDFPRIVRDAEYLVSKLAPVLAGHVERSRALSAHAEVADESSIRVMDGAVGTRDADLDRAALVLRVQELEHEIHTMRQGLAGIDAAETGRPERT